MKPERWDLGLVPCTSLKRPDGTTPVSLYRGGPFSLMMRHAAQRCDLIMIMSAKYGLLKLQDPITYYDKTIPLLSPEERKEYLMKIKPQLEALRGQRVLSYVPKVYFEALAEACPEVASRFSRPYKKLGSLPLFKILSNEVKSYGQSPSRR